MTRSILTLLLLLSQLLATTAYAVDEFSEIEICKDISFIARDMMTARQKDRPMSETLPNAIKRIEDWAEKYGLEMESNEAEEMAAELVMDAYAKSSYDVEELQRDQIGDFENSYFRACYSELTSDSEE